MSEYFEVTQDVLDMATELIGKYHIPLQSARIGFCFRDEAPKSKGKLTLGQASKVIDKVKPHLSEQLDFLIWLAYDTWEGMSNRQRLALIDHELCHCEYNDDSASLRKHDVEEFWCIIERYGLWRSDLIQGAPAMQKALQMSLPDIPGRGGVVSVQGFEGV